MCGLHFPPMWGRCTKDNGAGGNELPPVSEQRAESTKTSLRGAESSDDPHPCKSWTRFYHIALRYVYQLSPSVPGSRPIRRPGYCQVGCAIHFAFSARRARIVAKTNNTAVADATAASV